MATITAQQKVSASGDWTASIQRHACLSLALPSGPSTAPGYCFVPDYRVSLAENIWGVRSVHG
jgi:hypothetical protein